MQLLINVCTYVWDDRDAFIFKSNLIIHQYNSLISKVVSIVIVWLTIRYIPYIHKNGRKNICTQKRLVISRCFFSSKMHSWLLNYSSFFDDIKGKTIYVRTTYHIATFYTRFISVSRSQVTSWKQKLREYLFLFNGINLYVSKLAKAKNIDYAKFNT